jgi:hypothetical protein
MAPRPVADSTLVLEDGASPATAVARNGSLRIRSVPPKSAVFSDLPDGGKQIGLHLEVRAESRMDLTELIGLRITRATDETGQKIRHASDYVEAGPGNFMDGDVAFIGNSIELYDPMAGSGFRQIPISVVVDGKAIQKLGELSGILSARVRTAPEALITVDDVAKSIGKTHTASDGSEIKVTECKREEDGLFKLKVELKGSQILDPQNEMFQMRMGRLKGFRGAMVQEMQKMALSKDNPNSIPFKLLDAKGQPLEFVSGELDMAANNDGSRVYTLVYKPAANDAGPAKLEYIGRRDVLIEVPFTLKDVPLLPKDK